MASIEELRAQIAQAQQQIDWSLRRVRSLGAYAPTVLQRGGGRTDPGILRRDRPRRQGCNELRQIAFGRAMTPARLVAAIRANPLYDGGPVRLICCHSGRPGGSAQEVADRLGQPVLAATETVWATSHGHLFTGASDVNPNGRWVMLYPRSGVWTR